MPTPTGWVPDWYSPDDLGLLTDPTGNNFSTYSSYDPITLPRQFWPEEDQYNRVAAHMRSMGVEPPPRGTLDPRVTAEYSRLLYESPGFLDNPAKIAAVVMGGAALGGAFANGGAGYGAAAPAASGAATTYPYAAAGPVTATPIAGAGAGAGAAAGTAAAGGAAVNAAGGGLNWTTLVPSLVSGVTGILGANQQADASKDALALSERMFNTARADALPRIETGNRAVGALDDYFGLTDGTPNLSRFFESPSYQYNLTETTKAGERALSSMGLRNSGAAVREMQRNASGLASREDSKFIDSLLAAAGLGTTGAAASAAAGSNHAALGGNAIQNRGAARSSAYGAVNDAVQGGVGNYLFQQYLNRNPVYA